jgi:hypothetical protein
MSFDTNSFHVWYKRTRRVRVHLSGTNPTLRRVFQKYIWRDVDRCAITRSGVPPQTKMENRWDLRACLKSHVLAASRLVINWIMAIRIHVSVVSGKFDDPAPLQHSKSLRLARPFHDRKGTMQNSGYPSNQLPGVTPVCQDELQPRKARDQPLRTCLAP